MNTTQNTTSKTAAPTIMATPTQFRFVSKTLVEVTVGQGKSFHAKAEKLAEVLPKAQYKTVLDASWTNRVADTGRPVTIPVYPTVRRQLMDEFDHAELMAKFGAGISLGNFAFGGQ